MKKIIALLFVFTSLIFICSCASQPSYYNPDPLWNDNVEVEADSEFADIDGAEPSDQQISLCSKIFNHLCNCYNVEKEFPEVKVVSKNQLKNFTGVDSKATYYNNCLYILNTSDKVTIAHELCHYLSDTGISIGFDYALTKDASTGHYLTEGLTNYYSTNQYPYISENGMSFYEFETHVAALLAIIYGEENLRNDFFSANVYNLRDNFNAAVKNTYSSLTISGVKATPFDILAGCLDSYGFLVYVCDDSLVPDPFFNSRNLALQTALSIEEMLLYYAESKGKTAEVLSEIESFLQTATIPFEFSVFLEQTTE